MRQSVNVTMPLSPLDHARGSSSSLANQLLFPRSTSISSAMFSPPSRQPHVTSAAFAHARGLLRPAHPISTYYLKLLTFNKGPEKAPPLPRDPKYSSLYFYTYSLLVRFTSGLPNLKLAFASFFFDLLTNLLYSPYITKNIFMFIKLNFSNF